MYILLQGKTSRPINDIFEQTKYQFIDRIPHECEEAFHSLRFFYFFYS